MRTRIVLLAMVASACAFPHLRFSENVSSAKSYEGYRVLRATPATRAQLEAVNTLYENHVNMQLDFWSDPSALDEDIDINIPPDSLPEVTAWLAVHHVPNKIIIDDVQDLIASQRPATPPMLTSLAAPEDPDAFHKQYHTLDEINDFMVGLNRQFPHLTRLVTVGTSYEKRPIKGVVVTSQQAPASDGPSKPAFVMIGCHHAREWISTATVLYMLDKMVRNYGSNDSVRHYLDNLEFHIIPVVNVDGFVYTHEKDRLWRKTRRPNENSKCIGTDPNRNWKFKWGVAGSATDPCAENYQGSAPFTEPEPKAIADYVRSRKDTVRAFIDFHSFSQLWMSPWGWTDQHSPDYDDQTRVGKAAVKAVSRVHGTKFKEGPISTIIYPASGSSADETYGEYGVKYSFGVELRDTGRHGFLLPPEQIIPSGEEISAGVAAVAAQVIKEYGSTPTVV